MAKLVITAVFDKAQADAEIERFNQTVKHIPRPTITPKVEPTKMQQQIEAMVGIGEKTKSAAASAKVFEKANLDARLAADKLGEAVKGAGDNTTQFGNDANTAEGKAKALQDRLADLALNAIGRLFISAMRDAIDTMKAVDDELVTVRKVTGATGEELEQIRDRAYDVGKAYGVAANEYLQSVAAFSRAGYKSASADLAELSVKTQLVGDVTEDTADQFLLSVDKAYQYQGSIEALSKVLDGANEIDNKYATSIQKIAEGLGIIAPVAAQANVGVDELSAAIGTITAVTQRSGSESARALRALFLNILGDTKTEIEEGVTWTTGEIAGLRDVLNKYAPDVVAAARATGELINPMEAIGALAQSMKDGLLTEQELMETVSDIGGKLRASQLLALIQNWDMYQSMLGDYANAAGSADREVQNALDSWTRKAEILKNTWTELISNIADTSLIKGGLDIGTLAIGAMDNSIGHLIITFGALSVAGLTVDAVIKKMALSMELLGMSFKPALVFAAIGTALAAGSMLIKYINGQKKSLEELNSEYETMFGMGSEYENLKSRESELLLVEKRRLAVLEAIRAEKEKEIKLENEREFKKRSNIKLRSDPTDGYSKWITEAEASAKVGERDFNALTMEYRNGAKGADEYREGLQGVVKELQNAAEEAQNYKDMGFELSEGEEHLLDVYNDIADTLVMLEDEFGKLATSNGEILKQANAVKELHSQTTTLEEAIEKLNREGADTEGILQQLKDVGLDGYIEQLKDGTWTLTEAFNNNAAATYDLFLKTTYAAAGENGLQTAMSWVKTQAGYLPGAMGAATTAIIKGGDAAYNATFRMLGFASAMSSVLGAVGGVGVKVNNPPVVTTGGGVGGGGGGGGGSSSKKDPNEKLKDELDDILEDMEHQIFLWEQKGNMSTAIIEQYRKMQQKTHELAEKYRAKGLDENSKYIQELQKQWVEYNDKIKEIVTDLWDELEDAIDREIRQAEKAKDLEIKAIDDQINALKEAGEKEDELLTLEEKRLAVLEAEQNLLNAQNERTIRVYNNATGQWEWVADRENVKDAEEDLKDAKKDLEDYERELKINELERRKDAIEAAFKAFEDQWDAIKESIEEPGRDIAEILSDISKNGTPKMKAVIDDVTTMLGGLANYIGTSIGLDSGASFIGGGGAQDLDFKGDKTNYAQLMLDAPDKATFDYFAALRLEKIKSQGIDLNKNGWAVNDELYRQWLRKRYSPTGINGEDNAELVDKVAMMSAYQNSGGMGGIAFGGNKTDASAILKGAATNITNATTNYSTNYYIDGAHIGEKEANSMTLAQLAMQVKPLMLYANA